MTEGVLSCPAAATLATQLTKRRELFREDSCLRRRSLIERNDLRVAHSLPFAAPAFVSDRYDDEVAQ